VLAETIWDGLVTWRRIVLDWPLAAWNARSFVRNTTSRCARADSPRFVIA
jgi:hypothetical protein